MRTAAISLYLLMSVLGMTQGYVNLTFDKPDLSNLSQDPSYPSLSFGEPRQMVPGWSIQTFGEPVARVWYNDQGRAGVFPVTLVKDFGEAGFQLQVNPNRLVNGQLRIDPVSISQVGLIPIGSTALEFYSSQGQATTDTYINGVKVEFEKISPLLYSLDISPYAGKETELKFAFRQITLFDPIGFVPEPTLIQLSIVGFLILFVGSSFHRQIN